MAQVVCRVAQACVFEQKGAQAADELETLLGEGIELEAVKGQELFIHQRGVSVAVDPWADKPEAGRWRRIVG